MFKGLKAATTKSFTLFSGSLGVIHNWRHVFLDFLYPMPHFLVIRYVFLDTEAFTLMFKRSDVIYKHRGEIYHDEW